MRALGLSLLLLIGFGAPAATQDEPGGVPVVEELIARPPTPGPAWWRVSDDDSTIYVLVVPPWLPKDIGWDQSVLDRRMKGANRLILPPRANLNPLSFVSALAMVQELRTSQLLEPSLPEATRAKFVAARTAIGQPAEAYHHQKPDFAWSNLQSDYLAHKGIQRGAVLGAVEAAARRHKVRSQPVATMPISQARVDGDKLPGAACLDVRLDRLPARVEAIRTVAAAWAQGDVRPLIFAPQALRDPAICSAEAATNINALRPNFIAEHVQTFERALRTPGKAVAVIEPNLLLRRGGLLQQLAAKGYKVATPAVVED